MKIYNYYHLSWSSAFAIMDFHHVCNVTIVALESETNVEKYSFSFVKSNNLPCHYNFTSIQFAISFFSTFTN